MKLEKLLVNCIKSQDVFLILLLRIMKQELYIKHFRIPKYGALLRRNTCLCVALSYELKQSLFREIPLLHERKTDKPWLFRLGNWQAFSQKMNKMSLSLQGKRLTTSVANDKC
jgi:hypothetical protein